MDDIEFQRRSDAELHKLYGALLRAGDTYGFDTDFNAGALTVEFEDPPGKFVVSPNAPVKQIWVSAHVKSFKLDWSDAAQEFTLPDGQSLQQLLADCVGKQIGEEVTL
jgi:iron donor protein CyaY